MRQSVTRAARPRPAAHAVLRLLAATAPVAAAGAGEAPHSSRQADWPRLEVTTGSDHTESSHFGHGALIWAFGRSLYEPGWRLRLAGGLGQYQYDGTLALSTGATPLRFSGATGLGEVLLGYQWRLGGLSLKAYGGLQYGEHRIEPDDPGNPVRGSVWGGKAAVELWAELSEAVWLSLDGAYASAFDDYRVQARAGYRVHPAVSVGVEAAALGNAGFDAGRAGLFLRWHRPRVMVTVAAGASDDFYDGDPSPYGAIEVSRAFWSGVGGAHDNR